MRWGSKTKWQRVTGSVQKSVADFFIPMIVIYEKIMEIIDDLVEALKNPRTN
jgi:hypothetical protein